MALELAEDILEPDKDGIDLDTLIAFLREEAEKSRDEYTDDERANAIEFYNGEPFGDEEEGRSQVVTRDVAEVVDYMTVSLLRTMVSGDKVVEFEYADKDIADEATNAVSYQFMQGQDRSEEHTSELQSLMRISYAVFCLKNKKHHKTHRTK